MKGYWDLTKVLPNESNHKVITEFLLSLKVSNRSELTIITYRRFLEKFFGDRNEAYSALESPAILEWFNQHERLSSATTLRLRLSILSSFYKFCISEEYISSSPIKSRWFPRLPQSLPKYLEKGEIAKIRYHSELTSLRNYALIEFMLTTGCRVSEVSQLNREDVDVVKRTAKIIGKGKKIRYVHFTEKCAYLLDRYLAMCPPSIELFVTTKGNRLQVRAIQLLLNRLSKKKGLDIELYPHRFRHTFATELLAKGADISFIGDELGHSDVGTTQIYARLPKREIIALYRKYMG